MLTEVTVATGGCSQQWAAEVAVAVVVAVAAAVLVVSGNGNQRQRGYHRHWRNGVGGRAM
jgi:hypothetical protein